jgi:YVTN family beta-propeller protein
VSVIDVSLNSVVGPYRRIEPSGVAGTPAGDRVYVSNQLSGTCQYQRHERVIDTVTMSFPQGIDFLPNGSRAYVTFLSAKSVGIIDTALNDQIGTIPVERNPVAISIAPDGTRGYVSNQNDNSLSVLDLTNNTRITDIDIGASPAGSR